MIKLYFTIMLAIQFIHSIEELSTGFHEKFPLFKMKFLTFLIFEILFLGFFVAVLLAPIPFREQLMALFIVLMFANGLWHMVWWGIVKRYVPGLITAPLFVVIFFVFYFRMIF